MRRGLTGSERGRFAGLIASIHRADATPLHQFLYAAGAIGELARHSATGVDQHGGRSTLDLICRYDLALPLKEDCPQAVARRFRPIHLDRVAADHRNLKAIAVLLLPVPDLRQQLVAWAAVRIRKEEQHRPLRGTETCQRDMPTGEVTKLEVGCLLSDGKTMDAPLTERRLQSLQAKEQPALLWKQPDEEPCLDCRDGEGGDGDGQSDPRDRAQRRAARDMWIRSTMPEHEAGPGGEEGVAQQRRCPDRSGVELAEAVAVGRPPPREAHR